MKYPYFFRTINRVFMMMGSDRMYRIDVDYFNGIYSMRSIGDKKVIYLTSYEMLVLIQPNLEVKRKIIMTLLGD